MQAAAAQAGGMPAVDDLLHAAQLCLAEADPLRKVALTRHCASLFRAGTLKLPADAPGPAPIRMRSRPSTGAKRSP